MVARLNRALPRVLLSLIVALLLAFVIGYIGVSGFGGEPIVVEKASAEQSAANDRSTIALEKASAKRSAANDQSTSGVEPRYGDSPYIKDIAYTATVDANALWRDYFAYYDAPWEDVQNIVWVCNDPNGSYYRPSNMNIYYDRCWDSNNYGDGAIAAIVAHEVGHHVQNMAGIYGHITVHTELHADCLAGIYMAQAWREGLLDGNDLEEAENWFYNSGDYEEWTNPVHHGTGEQRLSWFDLGWDTEDPAECDAALNLG